MKTQVMRSRMPAHRLPVKFCSENVKLTLCEVPHVSRVMWIAEDIVSGIFGGVDSTEAGAVDLLAEEMFQDAIRNAKAYGMEVV